MTKDIYWSHIETWRAQIITPVSDDDVESIDVQDWDARSVGVSDSFSIMAHDEHRKLIDQWREAGEVMHQQSGWEVSALERMEGMS